MDNFKLKEDTAPIAHRPRRLSPEEEAEFSKEIYDRMEMGARTVDRRLRLAIDYRGLNHISLPATFHPITRIYDLLDRLGEAKFFSVMNAKCGYHQLPRKEDEAELTAFVVPWGH